MNRSTKNIILISFLLLCSIFILASEGVNPGIFTLWNLLPIVIGYFVLKYSFVNRTSFVSSLPGFGYLILGIGFSLLTHAAWLFDWGETQTGSSTSGLMFIFIPVFSIVFGGAGFIVGGILHRLLQKQT